MGWLGMVGQATARWGMVGQARAGWDMQCRLKRDLAAQAFMR